VTQDYDAANKILSLKVRQEQRPDPESSYPQVVFFQTPVDIEIGTANSTRVERVQIEAKEEQTFRLAVDSEPLLVNFDYADTLIKELLFSKTTGQLLYQLAHDQDVLSRIWAAQQLAARMRDDKTASEDRQSILKGISEAATTDKFWGTRLEAVAALSGNPEARDALIAATKDSKARVRVRAVNSLRATKDPSVAGTYQELLNDQSYAVIHAAATALGETKSAAAYDSLLKLINTPSWRDNIRAAGLGGLEALADKRALELGFKYFAAGNPNSVRAAAVGLLGATGNDDPRTFPLISAALRDTIERRNFALFAGEANALVTLGDERGLGVFEELRKKAANSPQIVAAISNYETRLRAKLTPAKSKAEGPGSD